MKWKNQRCIVGILCVLMLIGLIFFDLSLAEAEAFSDPFAAMYDSDEKFLEDLQRYFPQEKTTGVSKGLIDLPMSEKNSSLIDNLYEQSRTDRFIIKYKSDNDKISFKNKIKASVRSSDETILSDNNMERILLREKVNPNELAEILITLGISKNIEYIQPDYIFDYSSVSLTYTAAEIKNGQIPKNDNDKIIENVSYDDITNQENTETNETNQVIEEERIHEEVIVALIDTGVDINNI